MYCVGFWSNGKKATLTILFVDNGGFFSCIAENFVQLGGLALLQTGNCAFLFKLAEALSWAELATLAISN